MRAGRFAPLFACLSLSLLACAPSTVRIGEVDDAVISTVRVPPDSALLLAGAELQTRGFQVHFAGPGMIVTMPSATPDSVQGRQWIVQVMAERRMLASGTQVRVAGYLVPPDGAPPSAEVRQTVRPTIPIKRHDAALFREVENVSGAILAALQRSR